MSKESVNLLVTGTITIINDKLRALNAAPTADQVESIFNDAIVHAYRQNLDEEDKTYLLKQFKLKFHPDRMGNNSSDFFAEQLSQDETLKQIPFKTLEQVNINANLFNALKTDPAAALQAFLNQFRLQFENELNQYKRYIEPISTMIYITQVVINTVLIAATISIILSVLISHGIMDSLKNGLFNMVTNNQYEKELEKNITDKERAKLAEKLLSASGIDTSNVQDDKEMLEILYTRRFIFAGKEWGYSEKDLTEMLKAGLSISTRIMAIFNAVANHITSALPSNLLGKGFSVLYRLLMATLIVPFIIIGASVDLFVTAVPVAILTILALALFAKVAATLLFNSPLYALEGLTYIGNALSQMIDKLRADFTVEAAPDSDSDNSAFHSRDSSNDATFIPNESRGNQKHATSSNQSPLVRNSLFPNNTSDGGANDELNETSSYRFQLD